VVQVSGGALTRTSSVAPSIKIKSKYREKGSTQFLEQGFIALLFFLLMGFVLLRGISLPRQISFEPDPSFHHIGGGCDGANKSDPAKL
jgi:hypothetical protein